MDRLFYSFRERIKNQIKSRPCIPFLRTFRAFRGSGVQILQNWIWILPEQQNLAALIAAYKKEKLGGINPNRKDDYVNDLFGFMMDASRIVQGWESRVTSSTPSSKS